MTVAQRRTRQLLPTVTLPVSITPYPTTTSCVVAPRATAFVHSTLPLLQMLLTLPLYSASKQTITGQFRCPLLHSRSGRPRCRDGPLAEESLRFDRKHHTDLTAGLRSACQAQSLSDAFSLHRFSKTSILATGLDRDFDHAPSSSASHPIC